MTTLRVVVDELVADAPGGARRYAEELTRQLIATAPPGCDVEGIVSNVPRRARSTTCAAACPASPASPACRSPAASSRSPGSPASRARRRARHAARAEPARARCASTTSSNDGDQIAVTIHDVARRGRTRSRSAPTTVLWHEGDGEARAQARRRDRGPDARRRRTGSPSSSTSATASGSSAAHRRPTLRLPPDADERAARLGLPERYALTLGSIMPRKGARAAHPGHRATRRRRASPCSSPAPIASASGSATGVAAAAGLPEDRVRALGHLDDADLAVVLDRATLFVYPSLAEGFGLPDRGGVQVRHCPVIHSDDPALVEVAAGASLIVERPATPDGRRRVRRAARRGDRPRADRRRAARPARRARRRPRPGVQLARLRRAGLAASRRPVGDRRRPVGVSRHGLRRLVRDRRSVGVSRIGGAGVRALASASAISSRPNQARSAPTPTRRPRATSRGCASRPAR